MSILDKIQQIHLQLSESEYYVSATSRRETFVNSMNLNAINGQSCQGCIGECCSSSSNSMKCDPLQAFDLIYWLSFNNKLDDRLIELLQQNIVTNRLDKEVFTKRNQTMRRYYTCPFYLGREKGCSISRYAKPYGCLAFNKNANGSCVSDQKLLSEVTENFNRQISQMNKLLSQNLNLDWTQLEMPKALLQIYFALKT